MKDFIEFVLFCLLMGALMFGVRIGDKRYVITCNSKDGAGVKAEAVELVK